MFINYYDLIVQKDKQTMPIIHSINSNSWELMMNVQINQVCQIINIYISSSEVVLRLNMYLTW